MERLNKEFYDPSWDMVVEMNEGKSARELKITTYCAKLFFLLIVVRALLMQWTWKLFPNNIFSLGVLMIFLMVVVLYIGHHNYKRLNIIENFKKAEQLRLLCSECGTPVKGDLSEKG